MHRQTKIRIICATNPPDPVKHATVSRRAVEVLTVNATFRMRFALNVVKNIEYKAERPESRRITIKCQNKE
jgi:hypothetical protein